MPSVSVYSGKINFPEEAENEHVALVIPFDITNGAPVGLYFQWSTQTWNHKEKQNHQVNATFRDVTASEREVKGTFDDGDYKFEVTIGWIEGRQTLPVVVMSNWAGTTSSSTLSFREGSFHAPNNPVNKKVIESYAVTGAIWLSTHTMLTRIGPPLLFRNRNRRRRPHG